MLDANGWKHVFLERGVPSHKRGGLIETFHEDPACRVFLSTGDRKHGVESAKRECEER